MSTDDLLMLISLAGRLAVVRDTLYNVVKNYSVKKDLEFDATLN
jgi:hypothetical protein